MATSLVRSRAAITGTKDRFTWNEIKDGAVLQEDGVIVDVGTYDDLHRKHPTVPVIGTGKEVLLPGFVNGHHHVGLTPVQLGSPDMPLELWFITRMVIRNLDLYLDTLYSAFEMIGSGITTVQHIQGWMPGTLPDVEKRATETIRAYEDVGMRVSYCYAVRDQNRLVYQADEEFVAGLPKELQGPMQRWFDRFKMGLDDAMDMFKSFHSQHHNKRRVKIQLAPANLHWCSDKALTALSDASSKYDAPMHMHLNETAYQKEYAWRRGKCTALEYIDRFGMVNNRLTLGHGVWLNEKDIDRLAAAKGCVCHNCSSNFRLRSGVAALNFFEKKGVNTAIGLDEAGINEDRDMLQELKLALRVHRTPGMEEADVPTAPQIVRMATEGGAMTTAFGAEIGRLDAGRLFDAALIDWTKATYPYQDADIPMLDALVQRAKAQHVDAVYIGGELVYADGRFTRIDRDAVLAEIAGILNRPRTAEEIERRELGLAVFPHVKAFYDGYIRPGDRQPFYAGSSTV